MSRMAPPRRSNDGRPTSPATGPGNSSNSVDDARSRTSSEATPKTRNPLATDQFAAPPLGRRPNKPSLSSSSSAGLGGSENSFGAGPSQHLGVRSGSRAEMYPARDTAASPALSIGKPHTKLY